MAYIIIDILHVIAYMVYTEDIKLFINLFMKHNFSLLVSMVQYHMMRENIDEILVIHYIFPTKYFH